MAGIEVTILAFSPLTLTDAERFKLLTGVGIRLEDFVLEKLSYSSYGSMVKRQKHLLKELLASFYLRLIN